MAPDKVDELLRVRGGELPLFVDLAVHVQHVHSEAVGLQTEEGISGSVFKVRLDSRYINSNSQGL